MPPAACQQCRNRKVKCNRTADSPDEKPCVNCERLNFECTQSTAESLPTPQVFVGRAGENYTLAGTVRKRVPRACAACHSQKARCSAERPSCRRCTSRGFKCEYLPSKRKVLGVSPLSPGSESSSYATSHRDESSVRKSRSRSLLGAVQKQPVLTPSLEDSMCCDEATIETHIAAYFDYVYPLPTFSFLHRAFFMRDFRQGSCSLALLKAVCAAGAVFLSRSEEDETRRLAWIQEAESLVVENMEDTSLSNIQTILLLSFSSSAARKFKKGMFLLSIAARMAFISRMNYETPGMPFILAESRRRCMWGLYIQDTLYAGGMPELAVCLASNNHIKLPSKEMDFEMDSESYSEPLHKQNPSAPSSELGIMAYFIRIYDIRDRILRYTRSPEIQNNNTPNCTRVDDFEIFSNELHQWKKSLPPLFAFNERSLVLHAYSPTRKTLIMLNFFWYQCFCDLYRPLFSLFKEAFPRPFLESLPLEYVRACQRSCYEHALQLASDFQVILKLDSSDGLVVTDAIIAHCAYSSVRIMSQRRHIQVENIVVSEVEVLNLMRGCYNVLTPLREVYPSVYRIQDDISAMVQQYQITQTAVQDGEPPRLSPTASGTWNAVNQERIMTKHGILEEVYQEQMKQDPPPIASTEKPGPVATFIEIESSRNEGMVSNNMDMNMAAGLEANQMMHSAVDNFEPNNNLWNQDWNNPYNETNTNDLMDPFFRIQDEFGKLRKL